MRLWKKAAAAVALIGVAVAFAWWLVSRPYRNDPAALLDYLPPHADLYAVLDLQGLLSNPAIRKWLSDPPDVELAAEYRAFVERTGFRYQQDLRHLAVARNADDWFGVARARLDRPRITDYLESRAAVATRHPGGIFYSIGTVRPFRLAFLSDNLLAFSAGGGEADFRLLGERYARNSPEGAGAELRRTGELHRLLPESELWLWARIDKLLEHSLRGPRLGPFHLGREVFRGSRTFYLSVESGPLTLSVRGENVCDSPTDAEQIVRWLRTLIALMRPASPSQPDSGKNLAPLFDAVRVRQEGTSAIVEWEWNASMLALLD